MKTVSVDTMRALDAAAIAAGIPGEVLMERAGRAAAAEIRREIRRGAWGAVRRLVVLAGKGNNGGDGYVVAREIAEHGPCPVAVWAVAPPESLRDAALHHARLLPESVPCQVVGELPAGAFQAGDVIVDALLGTGTSGVPRAPFDQWIERLNASGCPVVCLDIPSGLDGDTGAAPGAVVQADLTVTMALPKAGMLAEAGRPCCGRLRCVDIGFSAATVAAAAGVGEALFAADIRPLLGRRSPAAHKGTFGSVLVLGGSRLYGGAPLLSGVAALRVGAGLATVARPAGAARFASPCLSLIVQDMPDGGSGFLGAEARPEVDGLLDRQQAVVFGPGIGGQAPAGDLLAAVLAAPVPVVLDADGLRLLAARPDLAAAAVGGLVLTPHPGEMRALLAGFGLERLLAAPRREQALALAERVGAVVVLKGLGTEIAAPDGRQWTNTSGSPALATAGTGDVLAGMVGGWLAQGRKPAVAARLAVFVHGLAGELWSQAVGSMIADDVPDLIGPALRELSPLV